jgi:hypothetical protein
MGGLEKKLDMLLLFQKLETPREKDLHKFIDEKGGPEKCLKSDQLLKELIDKSGEGYAGVLGADYIRGEDGLAASRKQLSKDLGEDIDEALKKNFRLFERKLDFQQKQLDDLQVSFHTESQRIITTILSGSHDRIDDPVSFLSLDRSHADVLIGC